MSSIQWICREWVGKLGYNELGKNYNGSRWQESKSGLILSKENYSQHNPKKSVLVYITWSWLQIQF